MSLDLGVVARGVKPLVATVVVGVAAIFETAFEETVVVAGGDGIATRVPLEGMFELCGGEGGGG